MTTITHTVPDTHTLSGCIQPHPLSDTHAEPPAHLHTCTLAHTYTLFRTLTFLYAHSLSFSLSHIFEHTGMKTCCLYSLLLLSFSFPLSLSLSHTHIYSSTRRYAEILPVELDTNDKGDAAFENKANEVLKKVQQCVANT